MSNEESLLFEIVRPIPAHARIVMDWRNDPVTLQMSYNKKPKVWETFWDEFRQYYFIPGELPPLFVWCDGCRVAFLRFKNIVNPANANRRSCEISINVAPHERKKGYGKRVLIGVKEWVKEQGYDDIFAEVKQENVPSQRLFLAAGYREMESTLKLLEETGEQCRILCYKAALTPQKANSDKVYIVAEAGSNWRMGAPDRDWAMARTLIDIAVEAGVDAVKFQTYRPETVYVPNAGVTHYLSEAGIDDDIFSIFADLSMPYEMIRKLADYCRDAGIDFLSTPFSEADFRAVDPYVARHKIASYEISHLRLLQLAARSGKSLILSTGASNEEEIDWAVRTFYQEGGEHLTLLQCTAKYPAEPGTLNLLTIPYMMQRYRVPVGLSDHSRDPVVAPVAAVALGASVIEKHFTLSNQLPGPDHAFALLPNELKLMAVSIREAEAMRGNGLKDVQPSEQELRSFARRGIQALHPIAKGTIFHEGGNIAILRPGNQRQGLHPRHLIEIEGKMAARDIPMGDGIVRGDWE
jgi:N-acetylneuraminate synthase